LKEFFIRRGRDIPAVDIVECSVDFDLYAWFDVVFDVFGFEGDFWSVFCGESRSIYSGLFYELWE